MKIALIDISLLGHRTSYFKYYSKVLVEKGNDVYIFCPGTKELKASIDRDSLNQIHFIEYELQKAKPFFLKKCTPAINTIRNWIYLSRLIKQNVPNVDLVFFLGLDYFILTFSPVVYFRIKFYKLLNRLIPLLVDTIFPYKWAGINLRLDIEVEHVHKSKKNIAIGLLDEYFVFKNNSLNQKIIVFPDIANTELMSHKTKLEQNVLAKANGRKIISILGAIDKRKSISTFLDIAQVCQNKEYFFVIAGTPIYETFNKFEKDRFASIKNNIDNCYFFPESINDGPEFNALINLSDVVFASYLEFFNSSNILTKIAFFKKPVIVSKRGCMGKRIEKYQIGLSMEEGMVSDGIKSIDEAINKFDHNVAKFDLYFDSHSENALQKVLDGLTGRIVK